MTTRADLATATARILDGMVWLESGRIPMPWHRSLVAYASSHQPGGGAFRAGIAALREADLIGYLDGRLVLEHGGRLLAEEPLADYRFTREAYWQRLSEKLPPTQRWICEVFQHDRSACLHRDILAEAAGIRSNSAPFRNAIAKLLSVALLTGNGDRYSSTEALWPLTVFERRTLEGRRRARQRLGVPCDDSP